MIASCRTTQKGAALLLVMLVILAASSAILVSRFGTAQFEARRAVATADALSEARAALLAYAAAEPELVAGAPARLPCPDLDGTGGFAPGEAHTSACGAVGESMLGRLPWRTLGVAALKDASAACLWYAVSGDFKSAGTSSAELLNPDTTGDFRVFDAADGNLLAGATAASRPVALLFAAGPPLPGQRRLSAGDGGCGTTDDAAQFLDAVAALGIDNAAVSGVPDTLQDFVSGRGADSGISDRLLMIRRSELADIVNRRDDYRSRREALGLAVTACLAEWGRHNGGGANDRRLPWPAPLTLTDYRVDSGYDDTGSIDLGGRLPDRVDDSAAASGNALNDVLSACDSVAVPAWTPAMQTQWQQWKDHFFYVVAESHAPGAAVPSTCGNCLTINGAAQYAAVVLFAGPALAAQTRTAPPLDVDSKRDVGNYLEGRNALAFPYVSGTRDLESSASTSAFNDLLFCVDTNLNVARC